MSLPRDQAWFRAKRYGYGWGWPARWQGWLVFAIYVSVIFFAGRRFEPSRAVEFAAWVIIPTFLLVAICAWKGERPRWRWGRSDDDDKPA